MQQTLFAILGLMIATLLSFSQQRQVLRTQEKLIGMEMEVMASGVALQAIEYIGRKDFDNYTTNNQTVDSPSELTNKSGFGQQYAERCDLKGENTSYPYQVCDDIDDFDDMPAETVLFNTEAGSIPFEVTATVKYVDTEGNEASGKTFNKEVTVYVQDAGARQFMRVPITVSRTYSYEKLK